MKTNEAFFKMMTYIITLTLLVISIQNQILIGKMSILNQITQNRQNSFAKPVLLSDCPCPWMNNDGSINVVIRKSALLDININSTSTYGYLDELIRQPLRNGQIPVYLNK